MTSTKSVVLFALCFLVAGVSAQPAQTQTFKVLHYFTGGTDGGTPTSSVVIDTTGNLYGTTSGGGNAGCFDGCGVVFELSPGSGGWTESTLHTFTGGSDGGYPIAGLTPDAAGNLYGTACFGGVSGCSDYGCGVAFELSPDSSGWTENVLYSFQGGTGGSNPYAGLVFDKAGHIYSTLTDGGSYNTGVVYELIRGSNGWKQKILYSSQGGPEDAPILDAAGNLYATAFHAPTAFELVHGTWKEKTLYDGYGSDAMGSLIFDKRGNLYGTAEWGGDYQQGMVFKVALGARGKWKETVLHSFNGGKDGRSPSSTLVFDKAGNLYGTTFSGGDPKCQPPYGCGTVFKLTPLKGGQWKETIVHSFHGSDGKGPFFGALAIDASGNLYGTAEVGGDAGCSDAGCGVVFEITP